MTPSSSSSKCSRAPSRSRFALVDSTNRVSGSFGNAVAGGAARKGTLVKAAIADRRGSVFGMNDRDVVMERSRRQSVRMRGLGGGVRMRGLG